MRRAGFLAALLFISSFAEAGDDLSLYRKATLFDTDLQERFLINHQVAPKLREPRWWRRYVTYNMPDNAYMTGLYCAAQSWRYAITGSPEAKAQAREAIEGIKHLLSVSGEPGLLVRASIPADMPWSDGGKWRLSPDGKYRWKGDVSTDQVDGVMFGLYVFSTTIATVEERKELAKWAGTFAGRILDHGLAIRDFNGKRTQWSHYDPTYVRETEPMNALLALQWLKVAAFLTEEPRFEAEYHWLVDEEGYAEIAERSRAAGEPWKVNHSDDVLIAIGLYPLMDLERDAKIREHYLRAIERWFHGTEGYPGVDAEANPFASFLYARWTGEKSFCAGGVDTLRRAPLDMKWNRATIDRYAERFQFKFEPDSPPLPKKHAFAAIDQRKKTWSFLVDNPYTQAGKRRDQRMEFQGLDYSLSYWFGLAHGYIAEDATVTPADRRRGTIGDQP